ncbi:hypothetical protein A1O3_00638 [Capronia epimyces CBS 606.96]|uniref:NAD(P)-binding domain-containing protein n=1 Tax=Capronia epimyces CBS 606.96 TaxID=1182542 RepID=W9YHR4_9EURO|nr:uncharacterized protein A1O3_00638 [Capronia epimyces CBS 606.96]EXJ92088.1 hypothetical protein A1O3_00638 [Capronia epimyces CBS 606.96]
MKVVLFGSTGFIGKEVLDLCLKSPAVTSIIALSRRHLPVDGEGEGANPKLTVVMVEDFKVYPSSILEHLKGADACIWSIGTYNWDSTVELEYPEAFQQALLKVLDVHVNKPFTYVYLGGAFTEPDQEKTLWFYTKGRRVRGLAQTKFLEFGRQNPSVKTYVVRPGGVLPGDGSGYALLGWLVPTVSVRSLAAVMVDLAVNGGSEQLVNNKVIVERGRELLMNQM